jgi:hypothetical protein
LPNAGLEVRQCLVGHRALSFVDLKPEVTVELPEPRHHPLPSSDTAHIDVAVIGVAREAVPARLQRLVHIVEQHVG